MTVATAWLERLRRVLPAAWFGLLAGIAFLAAPAAFAVLAVPDAGRVNSHLFRGEAWTSIGLGFVLWFIERARARREALERKSSLLSTEMILVLAVLFITFVATFALQPMMPAARAGQTWLSFGQIHAASVTLFATKTLLVGALAWRAAAR